MGVSVHGLVPREAFTIGDLWAVHLYRYHGAVEVRPHGIELSIEPGHVGLTPPDVEMAYRFDEHAEHVWAHFRLPVDGDAAPVAAGGGGEPPVELPLMSPLGPSHIDWWARMVGAVAYRRAQPARAAALVWSLLWTLVDDDPWPDPRVPAFPARHSGHEALGRAVQIIETRMAEPLRIAAIAAEVGISHNQLTRLMKEATGLSPLAYLRQRRVAQARYLLTHTSRPIQAIAREVGVPDPQHFNKVMRATTGQSPQALRRSSHPG